MESDSTAVTLLAVVAVLALVQSLFGVGVLMFGTPTLLLIGYSFQETLLTLLPASITISALQVWHAGTQPAAFTRRLVAWCLAPMVLGLSAVLVFDFRIGLNWLVAGMLAVFVVLRLLPATGVRLGGWSIRHERTWLCIMGLVHGLSNLGGAVLVTFAASRASRKEDVRALIAFCYLAFAASQLLVLVVAVPQGFGAPQLISAIIAGTVFLIAGDRTFRWLPRPAFDALLNVLCAGYAVLLGLRATGWW
jgi:uncharacterized membrane protein YfcA